MPQRSNRILCICTANICRSPMAARLLAHALSAEGEPYNSIEVISTGVAACRGEPASPNAVAALRKVGLSLDEHRSQPVTRDLLETSLMAFCMTESHRALLYYHFDPLPTSIYLMREFLLPPAGSEIPDPFGMDLRAYEACRDSMVEAIPSILRFLKSPQISQLIQK